MSTVTKRWWRVAVLGVVAGGAIGVARFASAEPIQPPLAPKDEPAAWARSAPAVPPPVVLPPAVVQASASFPVPASAGAPAFDPPGFGPRAPLTPPMLPGTELPGIPPAPKPFEVTPVAPPAPLPLAVPAPFVPPPAELAQPAPSVKPTEPVKPFSPVVPDFGLQAPKTGNTVRTDEPAPATVPVTPVVPSAPNLVPPFGGRKEVPALTVDRPKPVDVPLTDSEKFAFPLPTTPPLMPPPGDPVMMNYFKQAALTAVVGGAMAVAPLTPVSATPTAPTAAPLVPTAAPLVPTAAPLMPVNATPITPTAPLQEKADLTPAELKKAIDKTNEKLAEVETTLKRLTELLDGKKDDKGFYLPSDLGVATDVKNLKNSVASLQSQIDLLKKTEVLKPPGTSTPPPPAVVDPLAGKGTVRVVNDYPIEISIVVNEKSYRVPPSTKQDIPVAMGDFSYQLLQNGASAVKSTIKDKEVVTLRIK